MKPSRKTLRLGLSTLPGLVLLTGAVLKALDFDGFVEKALYYRVLDPLWIQVSALATIFVELILSILLLFRIWLRPFTLPAWIGLLLLFSALVGWAWQRFGIEDCGCFGSFVETPPWMALAKNGILLLMLGTLFFLERPPSGAKQPLRRQAQPLSSWAGLGFLGIGLAWAFWTLLPQLS
ncbi:MAG TPA: hypothetical protein ENK02_15775 [Planctomycetes bacterium]|nr:hypothetical protein [Planctomycetota bacterium]